MGAGNHFQGRFLLGVFDSHPDRYKAFAAGGGFHVVVPLMNLFRQTKQGLSSPKNNIFTNQLGYPVGEAVVFGQSVPNRIGGGGSFIPKLKGDDAPLIESL